jgi:hypothetical protein
MAVSWPFKDPNDVADYGLDWYGTTAKPGQMLIDADTITASIWIVPDGITRNSDAFDTRTTTIWLSGGTAGETYLLTNRITTAGGRTYDQTARLRVKDR